MTAALERGEWSAARPCRTLPPGKNRYPLYRRLGGPQGRSGRGENLVPTGIRSRTVQTVVRVAIPTELPPTPHTHTYTCESRYCVLILYLCSRVVSRYEWCRKLAAINVSHRYYTFGIAVSTFAVQIPRRFMFNKSCIKISCKILNKT